MKLIGMVSFYEEPIEMLRSNVEDLYRLGVGTIIAADGAYTSYPVGSPRSPAQCIHALQDACRAHGISLLLYQPSVTWIGDEVEKRQTMLDLAWTLSEDGDWFVIWDCDYKLVNSGPYIAEDVRTHLNLASEDFATVSFTESSQDDGWHEMQMFIRAQPVMMDGNHHTYKLADGRRSQVLRRPVENMAEALDLGGIKVRHRVHERDPERRARQTAYYEVRDKEGLEA